MTRVGQILQNATRVGHIRRPPPQSPTLRAITVYNHIENNVTDAAFI